MSDTITNTTNTNESKVFNVYVSKSTTAGTALFTRGSLNKTDTAPTVVGLYILEETGVYTNLGGIDAQDGKLNFASFDGTTWSLIAVPIVNNYITENTYNLDPNQIVPSEALYNDTSSTLAGDVLKRVDINTGEDVNYREVTTWHDGSPMEDTKADGVIYIKKNNKYYKRQFEGVVNVKWFGAKGDGVTDDYSSIINAVDFLKRKNGGNLFFPEGKYKVGQTLNLTNIKGIKISGVNRQYIYDVGLKNTATCVLDFDSVVGDGLVIDGFSAFEITDLAISRNNDSGFSALYLKSGFNYTVNNLVIDSGINALSHGIRLGGGSGETCAFNGTISNNRVIGRNGIGIGTYGGNTSLMFSSNYLVHVYFKIQGTIYSTFSNNAVDSTTTDYCYVIDSTNDYNTTNCTFISCGAEGAKKSAFFVGDFVQNIDFLNPYTTTSNTSGDEQSGDLMTIKAKYWIKNINITAPSAYYGGGNSSIYISGDCDNIFILNTNKKNLHKNIGGEVSKVSITGDYEWQPLDFSFVGNVNNAVLSFFYKRFGNEVTLRGSAVPNGSNVVFDFPTSQINTHDFFDFDGYIDSFLGPYKGNGGVKAKNDNLYLHVVNSDLPVYYQGKIYRDSKNLGL